MKGRCTMTGQTVVAATPETAIPPCPRCRALAVWRWGQLAGRSRYRCVRCGRTFTALTGSPQAYSKLQHLWPSHAQCLAESLSVRRTAARLGVSPSTAFRWRHRVISFWLIHRRPTLTGTVEIAASFYPDCHKGERNLARPPLRHREEELPRRAYLMLLRDERGSGLGLSFSLGAPSAGRLIHTLKPLLTQATALHTVSHPWFRLFARMLRLPHRVGLAGLRRWDVSGPLRRAGSAHVRLRRWLKGFFGVHVRYLDRYLAWFDVLDGATSSAAQLDAA